MRHFDSVHSLAPFFPDRLLIPYPILCLLFKKQTTNKQKNPPSPTCAAHVLLGAGLTPEVWLT